MASPGRLADPSFQWLCRLGALLPIVLLLALLAVLVQQSMPAFRQLEWASLVDKVWDPNRDHFGALAFVYGSVVTSLVGMVIAVPLGVGTAAFLAEIVPGWLRRSASFLVELLAAIPSVVYGFWGITFLAPAVQDVFNWVGGPNIGGKGLLSAGLILSIMCVPYVAAVAYDVIQAVPRAQREGALALGATRWQMIWRVVLPYARPGIIGGCFLALGRAIGETMAVTMIIGNAPVIQMLPFGRGNTIPSVIAQQLPSYVDELHASALIELGLLLLLVTVILNVLARVLIWRVGQTNVQGPRSRASRLGLLRAGSRFLDPVKPSAVWVNRLMTGVLGASVVITVLPLFLILGYITLRGVGALSWSFFWDLPRSMGSEQAGGLRNALYGSALMVGLATLFAVPLGILAAIYLGEYRRTRLGPLARFAGELLVGVPSIITGVFIFALIHFLIHNLKILGPREQYSGWAGALALGIMMIPIIMRAAEEALRLVPQSLRNASHALGAHHWQTVLRVTVPAAGSAIMTGVFLAIARIAGETAPLLLTAGGNVNMAWRPSQQMPALPVYIYQYSMSGYAPYERLAWAAAFVLLATVLLLNIGVRVLTGRRVVLASRAD